MFVEWINLLFFLQALIEFDDSDWQQREWIRIHSVFQVFLVEQTVVWSERLDPENKSTSLEWPALVCRPHSHKIMNKIKLVCRLYSHIYKSQSMPQVSNDLLDCLSSQLGWVTYKKWL